MHENKCYYRVGAITQTEEVVRMTAALWQVLASINTNNDTIVSRILQNMHTGIVTIVPSFMSIGEPPPILLEPNVVFS